MLEVKWSGEIKFKDNLKVYVEMAEDHSVIKAVWIDELGNEYPLGTVPAVTDLGVIDPDEYDGDVYEFLDTLTEVGQYRFFFDEFSYYVTVQTIQEDDLTIVGQVYWETEEGPTVVYYRAITIEDGEVISEDETQYLTLDTALNLFAGKNHVHYRMTNARMSVWDYIDQSSFETISGSPIVYVNRLDSSVWLIDTWLNTATRACKFVRVSSMLYPDKIYQRSAVRSGASYVWGNWYEFDSKIKDAQDPVGIQGNVHTVSNVASNSYTDYSVTFPEAYDTTPLVVACLAGTITAYGMGNVSIAVNNVSSTGFNARIYNASANSRNITFRYVAIPN